MTDKKLPFMSSFVGEYEPRFDLFFVLQALYFYSSSLRLM